MRYRIRRRRRNDHEGQPTSVQQAQPVQTKLGIGKPGDRFEKEADAVADKVIMMPNAVSGVQMNAPYSPQISMKCVECENEEKVQMQSKEEEEKVQMKSEDEEEKVQMKSDEEEKVQMKSEDEEVQMKSDEEEKVQMQPAVQTSADGKTYASSGFSGKLQSRKGKGSGLPDRVNAELSTKIGSDFSDVKIHTDSDSVQMNREIGAQAFTNGSDIYFSRNKYNPSTTEGKHLLAHELTHVVQQKGADTIQRTIGDDHDLAAPRFSGREQLEAAYDNERYVQIGSSGEYVSSLQQALVDIGYDLPKYGVDGIFGNETKSAVEIFQRDFGLSVDGIVGPQTMGTLDDVFSVVPGDTDFFDDGDADVQDGDSAQGSTFPAREHSLNSLAQSGESGPSGMIQTDLVMPPDKLETPPEIIEITIDLAGQNLKVKWSDKRETGPYTISSGKGCPNTKGEPCKGAKRSDSDTYCTPAGSGFKVEGLGGKDYKNANGDAMSWYVAFVKDRGIGIHNAQPVTGTPKSHGCVRVSDAAAKMIHNNVTTTTRIMVTGEAPAKKWTLDAKKTRKGYKGCPLPPKKKKKKIKFKKK